MDLPLNLSDAVLSRYEFWKRQVAYAVHKLFELLARDKLNRVSGVGHSPGNLVDYNEAVHAVYLQRQSGKGIKKKFNARDPNLLKEIHQRYIF
jgi:hypothetical protein